MTYFEFYNIAPSFLVGDAAALKRTFYDNAKKYHPDHATLADDTEQERIEALAALNNEAYQTLTNEDKRIAYLLRLEGETLENEQLPSDFLMQMMDMNDMLEELDSEKAKEVEEELNTIKQAIRQEADYALQNFSPEHPEKGELIKKVKNFYLKMRYCLRIQKTLITFASL